MIKNIILFKSNKTYIENATYINCETNKNIFEEIKKTNPNQINIYDQTHSSKHKQDEIIEVVDHINKTGCNPLIGNQHKLKQQFVDISKLYSNSEGVTTTCLGKDFEKHKKTHKYPSTHMCQISIVVRALGKSEIKGFLINRFC